MSAIMKMKHLEDPAKVVFDQAGMKKGKLPGFELMANRVLVGLYVRPEKTQGGIILTQKTRAEDIYQGKAAIVLALGPSAYVSDANFDFQGQKCEVGDWISIWVTDGKAIKINDADCRVLRDQDVTMKIPSPDQVY